MTIPLNISLEQLAETLNGLSDSERETLKSLLDDQWNDMKRVERTIQELLIKSSEQHREGKVRASEDIIRESKEKYGL